MNSQRKSDDSQLLFRRKFWALTPDEQQLLLDIVNEGIGERLASTNSDRNQEVQAAMMVKRKLEKMDMVPSKPKGQ